MYNTIENLQFYHFWTKNEMPCVPKKWMGEAKIRVRGKGKWKGLSQNNAKGEQHGGGKTTCNVLSD